MKKFITNFIKRLAQLNIIIGKTTLASIELVEDLDKMNKGFKDKLDTEQNEKRK